MIRRTRSGRQLSRAASLGRVRSPAIQRRAAAWLGLAALLVGAGAGLAAFARWLSVPPHPTRAGAIVALGGNHPRRTARAVALYRQGLAPQIWYTGYAPRRGAGLSSAELARQFALGAGVPAAAFRLLRSANTWEDGRAIAGLARQQRLDRLLVVTDWYHSRRALCAIRHQLAGSGIQVAYASAGEAGAGRGGWWRRGEERRLVLKELLAIPYYWFRYGLPPWGC